MQLLYTIREQKDKTLYLQDPRVVYKLNTVMRYKPWTECLIQQKNTTDRFHVKITDIDRQSITVEVLDRIGCPETQQEMEIHIAVSLPNHLRKVSLIVEKLTEIGIQHLHFRPSRHSQLQTLTEKQQQKCQDTILQAGEQSKARHLPQLHIHDDKRFLKTFSHRRILDQSGILWPPPRTPKKLSSQGQHCLLCIGPEWWWSEEEQDYFQSHHNTHIQQLWTNILRTETASILGAWEYKRYVFCTNEK